MNQSNNLRPSSVVWIRALSLLASLGLGATTTASPTLHAGLLTAATAAWLPQDLDGDGSPEGDDCDDANPLVFPGAVEFVDGIDNDCDGVIDEGRDMDGDGWPVEEDCDDNNDQIGPGAWEQQDGIDNDCNGIVDDFWDNDGDGWIALDDCDDTDPAVNWAAIEVCDGVDNNCDGLDNDCNGQIDEDCITDCNENSVADADEIAEFWVLDLDLDGRLDSCQIDEDPSLDCNEDHILDSVQLTDPEFAAVNDCDGNGRIDACDMKDEPSLDCNGNTVLDACEIALGFTEDCDGNLVPDTCEQFGYVLAQSDSMSPFGFTSPRTWTLANAAPTLTGPFDRVTLGMRIRGDFAGAGEYLTVYLNGRYAGDVPGQGPYDCDPNPLSGSDRFLRTLTIPGNLWNYALEFGGGNLNIEFRPAIAVDANRCPPSKPSFIQASVEYASTLEADCNQNGLLDVCEVQVAPWVDANHNGVPDECDGSATPMGCPGDVDGSGWVDAADISLILVSYGSPAVPGDPLDTDMSGIIDSADISVILIGFGPCP
jgi:hypothetical protein